MTPETNHDVEISIFHDYLEDQGLIVDRDPEEQDQWIYESKYFSVGGGCVGVVGVGGGVVGVGGGVAGVNVGGFAVGGVGFGFVSFVGVGGVGGSGISDISERVGG